MKMTNQYRFYGTLFHKLLPITLVCTLGLLTAKVETQQTNFNNNRALQSALTQISTGTENFSFKIFDSVSKQLSKSGYDFIISPFSIWSLLILIAEGSTGRTETELKQVLGLPQDFTDIRSVYSYLQGRFKVKTPTIQLSVNQAVFPDRNTQIENSYANLISRTYQADLIPVDYRNTYDAYYFINNYVYNATNYRIAKVVTIKDLRDAQLLLISSIYFKGQWKFPFKTSNTVEEPFYNEAGQNMGNCKMMSQKGAFAYTGIKDLSAFALELPYGKEDRLSMIFLLPAKNVKLETVIERLQKVGLQRILNDLKTAQEEYQDDEVEIFVPKFKIQADLVMNTILESLGLHDVFDPARSNLSKLTRTNNIFLSHIIHKAEIEVNEEGTTASAASGGAFINKQTPPRFYANRPFAYLIVEKQTNIILFCGQVRNPLKFNY